MGAIPDTSPRGISNHEVRVARAEAVSMLALMRTSRFTIAEVREFIGIEPQMEKELFRFARLFREEARFVDKVLRFRKEVNRQFDILTARAIGEFQEPAATHADHIVALDG